MICRKVLLLAGLTLCVIVHVSGQVVTSAQNGFWNDPSTWEGGTVPASGNSSFVRVIHDVSLSSTTEVGGLDVSGSLTITSSGFLELVPPQGGGILRVRDGGQLRVSGTLSGRDSLQFETNASNTFFEAGGTFVFRGSSRAYIPLAAWDAESVLYVNGFSGSGYVAIAYSEGWKQPFGHVIYECPLQTSFVDFNGHLRDIRGDLIIRNTNNQSLRLSTTQRPVLRIGRDLLVEGPSEFWVATTGDSTQLLIGRNFQYRSTSTGPSYLATRGRCHMQVGGTFLVDAAGPLRFCSGSADSTGVRRSTVAVSGDLSLMRGDLIAPSPGRGTFVFNGSSPQNVIIGTSVLSGSFDMHVAAASTVDFGTNVVRIDNGNVFIKGHIRVGSTDTGGALQNGNGGNLRVNGFMRFYPDAAVEYNGLARQFVGDGHPADGSVDVIFNNSSGVQLLADIVAGNVDVLSGELDANNQSIEAHGDVLVYEGAQLSHADALTLSGRRNALVSLRGARINGLNITKSEPADIVVASPLEIGASLVIVSENLVLNSNGHITLLSRSDVPGGTAGVARIPTGSSITGDVTVQRYMSGEGRLYRYLASPVANASVASMMDDFPVTGTFTDASTGPGIASASPSLFYYDQGWKPYPVSGIAAENYLAPGRGYAAFIRGGSDPVVWDVSGVLNQGPYALDVSRGVQEGDPFQGWNLVGNPYASPVRWGHAGWELQDIGSSIAVRDNGEKRFRYTDGEVGDLVNATVASCQAFWVYATDDDPTLVVNEAAKASADASFYRARETDHIQLSVTGPEGEDSAWIRLRSGASKAFDRFDAVKLPNDDLSLAILTTDSVAVAIAASDAFDCSSVIPISITGESGQFMKPGAYRFTIETSGMLSGATIRLIDHFTADTTSLNTFEFIVSEDKRSAHVNRFGILVTTSAPGELPTVTVPTPCQDTLVQINVSASETERVVAHLNDKSFYTDESGVLNITTPFSDGEETIKLTLEFEAVCKRFVLDTLELVRRRPLPKPLISDAARCGKGALSLTARLKGDYQIVWFANENYTDPIFRGDVFVTPELAESQWYFVLAEDSIGCRSKTVPVYCEVVALDSLEIDRHGHTLTSNYNNTKWFVNNEFRHVGQSFELIASGYITATAEIQGCLVESSYGYYGYEPVVIPTLFDTQLSISVPRGGMAGVIDEVFVYDNLGRQILCRFPASDHLDIDTTHWPHGVFIVAMRANGNTYRIRIVKKN